MVLKNQKSIEFLMMYVIDNLLLLTKMMGDLKVKCKMYTFVTCVPYHQTPLFSNDIWSVGGYGKLTGQIGVRVLDFAAREKPENQQKKIGDSRKR